ncbi:MAG: C25 family cysteine peptidase [Bacteroides sp.]|nr:C25 family cysteine peptidase [Ruminococcus flavefaciens]MCM1555106.1 C25 family cysteine peptidase [Bacteroides sp.]
MKAGKLMSALVCGLAFSAFVPAQTGRVLSVNSRMETALRVVSDAEEALELSNRLGGIDRAAAFSVPADAYTAASTAGVPQAFTTLSVQGYTYTNKVGYPMLPVRVELIEVPQGATPRVVYGKTACKDIDLAKAGYPQPIYPVQAPVSKSAKASPDFAYNAEAYRADGFLSNGSEELVTVQVLGEMRATRIAKVVVNPVQYNASTHTLRVYTVLDFEIVYDQADWNATYAKKARYASPAFGLLRNEVANPVDTKAVMAESPMRYVIVADPMFRDSLQKFVEWKTRLGYEVVQVYTDQIEGGKPNIRYHLKNLYDNASETEPAPSYVLFVGDLAQIPTKKYSGTGAWGDNGHYSDLYLCEYTDDHFPDVHYGRMSASTVEELMPQINKTIYMESLTSERSLFLDTAVVIAGVDDTYGRSHLNPTVEYLHSLYMDTLGRYGYKYLYPQSGNQSADIIRNIDAGLSVAIYTAHGSQTSWAEPYISTADVSAFTNEGKYPLMVGNCCLTGAFDTKTCFAEALLRKKDAGAVVYIGGSNSTYFDQDVYWAVGYTNRLVNGTVFTYENTGLGANDAWYHSHNEAYEDWALTAHEIVYTGNMAVERANQDLEEYYWEVYHVFGDPSYMPYTRRPAELRLEHTPSLVVGDVSFDVSTVPYARVTLSKNGVIFGFAITDGRGEARLALQGLDSACMVNLTVVAQDYLPVHKEVEVLARRRKHLIVSGQEMTDASGNVVRSGLYGETYRLSYTLRNVGKMDIGRVDVVLESKDEYLTVEDNTYTLDQALAPGETVALDHGFTLKVDKNVPDRHTLAFALNMVMDGETDSTLAKEGKFVVEAPEIRVAGFKIDDAAGSNPNGVIDNGETVKAEVTLVNPSEITAESVQVRVSSQARYLKLPDSVFEIGTLAGMEQKTFTFGYGATDENVHYALYTLNFDFDTKGRKCTDQVVSYISPVVETFESGDFSFVDWDEASDWTIGQDNAHQGKYSAASAPVADNGKSTLSIKVDVPIDDVVGFYFRTSSEKLNNTLGDFLCFYIDGVRQGSWGGIDSVWRYAEFPVVAGERTLAWTYAKDASESKGEDKVWIDDVRLPIGSHTPVANERKTPVESLALMQVTGAVSDVLNVRFDSREPLSGSLYVVNAMGQRVRALASGMRVDAGTETLSFPVAGLASGVYVLVFETASGSRYAVKFVKAA